MAYQKSILLMILSINLCQYAHTAKDVLNIGDELLSGNSTSNLISSNGMFTLGFFKVPTINFTYLGIWYTNAIELADSSSSNYGLTWVANRDEPVIGDGGVLVLRIDESGGGLKVVNGSTGVTLFNVFYGSWKKNTTTIIRDAVLEDSGNFIVRDDANEILWQSFDHLTDMLIPGMKVGYNLTTKQNWTLTSPLSDKIVGSGAFTMKLEEYQKNSSQLVVYRRGELYWASGPWNNGTFKYLELYLSDESHSKISLDLISDHSGMYVIYSTGTASSMLRLSPMGSLNVTGTVTDLCIFDQLNDGCVESTISNCHDSYVWNGKNITGNYIPENVTYYDDNQSISITDCMERCWKDCNCGGCATNVNGTGCFTWTQQVNFSLISTSKFPSQVYTLEPNTPYTEKEKEKEISRKWIWICIVVSIVGMLTFVLLVACLYCFRIRRRKFTEKEHRKRDIYQLTRSNSFNFGDELEKGFKDAPNVKIFSLKAILAATSNFSDENKLGEGGYGVVYKGELSDGRKIAVKRLSKTSVQGILEFKSELILISKLQHTNLVRLYGCCIHQEEKMLIYEYMPNKSLDFFLFDEDKKEEINWQIRFNIIEGVAQGLLYLHKYSRMKVIHRDLKVSNLLLDENMNPKIADFGMARIFHQNVTQEITNEVVGTYGYMAPEYAMQGTFSIKSDVFSFGVLMLEIISGKRNSSLYNFDMPLNLVGYAWELWKRETSIELKDRALDETCDVNQLLRCIHVGLLCVQENANDRPTMSEIVYMLNRENLDLPNPKQPAFLTQPNDAQSSKSAENLLGNNIKLSVNSLTLTTMETR